MFSALVTLIRLDLRIILSSALDFVIAAKIASSNPSYQSIQVANISSIAKLVAVLKQPCHYFFAMIFLGACIYTVAINLKMKFATLNGIDYIIFYGFCSLLIIASRFIFSKPLSKIAAQSGIPCLVFMHIADISCLFLAPIYQLHFTFIKLN